MIVPQPPAVEEPDLITGAEAARILHVDRATAYRWGRSGRLRVAVQLQRGQLFDRSEVEALAEQLADTKEAS